MDSLINIQHFGAKLRSKDGLFTVTLPDLNGGATRVEEFAAPHVQTILLHPKTSLTTDAALLAEQHGITCIILDEKGEPTIFLAGTRPSRSLEIWKHQLLLHGTPEGLDFAREWLCVKVQRKLEWLPKLKSYRQDQPDALKIIDETSASLQETLTRLRNQSLQNVPVAAAELRGIEGNGHKTYLALINALLPRQYKFDARSRQPAQDLFNAMLNYGYGILYNWTESALWESGANPYFGFLHSGERQHKALLFDFIESYRPWVDRVVFKLCVRKIATLQHVEPHADGGGLWLNKEGRKLLATAVYEKFRRKLSPIDGENAWTLRSSIAKDAVHFAQRMLRLKTLLGTHPKRTQHSVSLLAL